MIVFQNWNGEVPAGITPFDEADFSSLRTFGLHGFANAVTEGSQSIIQADDADAGPLVEDEAKEA